MLKRNASYPIFFVLFFLVTSSFASNIYYVAPGGTDASDGSYENPWLTLSHVSSQAQPGDTVIFKDGTYTEESSWDDNIIWGRIETSGSEAQPITFKAENNRKAIFDAQNNTNYVVWTSPTTEYVIFDGFIFTNAKKTCIHFDAASNIVVKNSNIQNCGNILVEDCTDGYGRGGAYSRPGSHDIYQEGNRYTNNGRIANLECDALSGSENHNYRHDHHLYLQGYNHFVSNNIFDPAHAGYQIKVDGRLNGAGIGVDITHYIVNNTFYGNERPDASAGGAIRIFNNNTFGDWPDPKPLIEGNIFFESGAAGYSGAVRMQPPGPPYAVGAIIRNNITTEPEIFYSGAVNVDSSGNIVDQNPLTFGFINPPTDLGLMPSSPAIGFGSTVNNNPPTSSFSIPILSGWWYLALLMVLILAVATNFVPRT
ncbi:MAG: chondroitinase-B domain-containing protein [Thiotrichaceae bacterium]